MPKTKPTARKVPKSSPAPLQPFSPSALQPSSDCIRLRGVRQNNLKNFDLDLPLGRYIAVTGLSGAGKSSLVFDTLHAEGQRRYVETFSAYTRQFLELLDKPDVDSIENIRPSIAIQQTNTVKTSRSTVGTMTELTDYFKVWFSHVAACYDPETGERVEDDTPASIWEKTSASHAGKNILIAFAITRPANLTWPEILQNLQAQSYLRALLPSPLAPSTAPAGKNAPTFFAARIPDLLADPAPLADSTRLLVVQDRLASTPETHARFLEAVETAYHFGDNQLHLLSESAHQAFSAIGHFSRGLHSPKSGRRFRPASPALFSFNSPLGACPHCKGFGRIIEIDYRLALPDQSRSIDDGAIKCWESDVYGECKKDLYVFAKKQKIPTSVPFASLTPAQQSLIIDGEPGYGTDGRVWPEAWYGLKGFFRWLETKSYKMPVRVFLSRYRSYNPCPTCSGTRLQPESLCWRWQNHTLPSLYQLPIDDLLRILPESDEKAEGLNAERLKDKPSPENTIHPSRTTTVPQSSDSALQPFSHSALSLSLAAIRTRLRYLQQVGLGYLTLDRPSKTLSGGEVQRVNLTSCLGTSLVDTLFVLDEPSVGLHPRDIDRLISIIRTLTDTGNTVVVVEHDEAMIRAADHIVEIGPEPGSRGGHITFQGPPSALASAQNSYTADYLTSRRTIATPNARRPVARKAEGLNAERLKGNPSQEASTSQASSFPLQPFSPSAFQPFLYLAGVTKHNLRNLTLRLPLQRLVALTGVSGSGKSTLLDHALYQNLLAARHQLTDDPAALESLHSDIDFAEIILVDQSPLSRTPRSNPALYVEAWEIIRDLYSATPAAQAAGLGPSAFSFNTGEGRCDHCQGLGYERVEMQFLSDVFIPCPICETKRFKPEILAITWRDHSISDLLNTSVTDALALFSDLSVVKNRLQPLADVGLGYLTLGQPLNTLSGGESQRLKLVRHLAVAGHGSSVMGDRSKTAASNPSPITHHPSPGGSAALLLLDEPTTGLHRHDVARLISVLQRLVDHGHSVVLVEHNLDILKSCDWLIEIGPEAGAAGGRLVAEGTPEHIATLSTATAPYLRSVLECGGSTPLSTARLDSPPPSPLALRPSPVSAIALTGARENNLKNLSLEIPRHKLNVVTGVSGSGKSTLAFDIIFAEGQRRFMESMSSYARQFVEQLPRPDLDSLTGIPPTVAIEQRVTRGSRKSTVATITEVAQYLRLLYARLGVQHHPDTGHPVEPLTLGQLQKLLENILATPAAKKAKHLYLCAPLVRGRKGHHQPIATWIANHGYTLMRADGRLQPVDTFQKLDRYKEHDIEVVVSDLKSLTSPKSKVKRPKPPPPAAPQRGRTRPSSLDLPTFDSASDALRAALALGHGTCFLLTPQNQILTHFSTTRTDIATGESFPELDPKHFSFNSPRGWCPACRGHGRIFPWMLQPADEETPEENYLRESGLVAPDADLTDDGQPCPECHGQRLNRIARAVKLRFTGERLKTEKTTRPKKPQPRSGSPSALQPFSLSLPQLLSSTPSQLLHLLDQLALDNRSRLILQDIRPQIEERLRFLDHVGLGYLSLDRPTETLSGGEAQRIRLAAQLGTNLTGVLYVLDEPSIGLHARDNDRLIDTLQTLCAKGNTLLVVEHDDELMSRADHIIDLGPAAGIHGGQLLAQGTPAEIRANPLSLTGQYLRHGIAHPLRGAYRPVAEKAEGLKAEKLKKNTLRKTKNSKPTTAAPLQPFSPSVFQPSPEMLRISGCRLRTLKNLDLQLPLSRLTMICGPSGAGKSTLFRDLLVPAIQHALKTKSKKLTGQAYLKATTKSAAPQRGRTRPSTLDLQTFDELRLPQLFRSVIEVDQSPIGKTPRSTPATYLGIFDQIRQFFASLPESKIHGYTASRFSFNTAGGRCETCSGAGRVKLEMAFMPDTYQTCDTCNGTRYAPELSGLTWNGKNISAVLALTFEEAAAYFSFHSQLSATCQLMIDCGLGYLTLGQSSPTLSGGEAQRLKLVTELAQGQATYKERSRGELPKNFYLLEEPTIGLHLSDCEKLIRLLQRLVDQGHTVVVIEHNLDLLAEADWIIELGPTGGPDGGHLLYQGELSGLLKTKNSPTAPYLKKLLGNPQSHAPKTHFSS